MLAQPKNRVQAIKSKFESLNSENDVLVRKKSNQLNKQGISHETKTDIQCGFIGRSEEALSQEGKSNHEHDSSLGEWSVEPNTSYLYSVNDVKKNVGESKAALTRQTSDPGKKLHRSHAFRCDRNIKISPGPKRHGSCNGRSETGDFTLKMGEKKLSKEKLKQLGSFLETQMKKENFKPSIESAVIVGKVCHVNGDSLADSQVPKHILDQYAKVNKAKKEEKLDSMTDSGVSSETENLEEIKSSKTDVAVSLSENTENIVNLEKSKPDLESKSDLYASSETMRLERKNPHLKLTDTLKKALKQPLPPGPPPEKPPRIFAATSNESKETKKDTKKMLEKLEEVLHKRETRTETKNIYDIVEEDDTIKPKEIHYLCTDILDVNQRSFMPLNDSVKTPISKCLNSLNCAIVGNSTLSLPYTKLSNTDADPCCSCSNENLMEHKCLSTFKDPGKCLKCKANELSEGFKCHVNCMCKESKSEFYVKEHIYYEPFEMSKSERHYGTLNVWKVDGASRSMEDLIIKKTEDEKIYDEPSVTRPNDGIAKTDFQKLIDSFEKPPSTTTSPAPPEKVWKSTENVCDDYKVAKQAVSKIFATEPKRYKKNEKMRAGPDHLKRDFQVDVDRENLNRLMSEIYETVTAVCSMDENKPGSFPTETTDAASEESVRLTRSLTEKRKNYVRRVSSRVAYIEPKNVKNIRFRHETSVCSYKSDIDNPYSTFRSWKSFRNSQTNLSRDKMERTDSTDSKFNLTDSSGNVLSMKGDISDESMDNLSIDEKLGCVDIDLPFEPREKGLFNFCVLVGLNYFTGQAYVKSVFPSQVQVPPHIENLVFPETLSPGSGSAGEWAAERNGQCYSLVLTDERGERAYGYCRRVLPEGATTCLPLCYCLIGKYRAPGFYYKILKEIESHHGNSEVEINRILQQLFETDFPGPGEEVTVAYRRATPGREPAPDQCDIENNNDPKTDLSIRRQVIRRPIEPRADEDNMSTLLDELGAGLVIRVFGSLLLERKVVVVGDQLSTVSSCVEALQAALYPLVWQQPLVAAIPAEIHRDVLEAPLPILAGMLRTSALHDDVLFEEGMLIDLTSPNKVLFYQGDESTILPTPSYKTLKTSLQMESAKGRDRPEDTKTRNVMIAEAFLRFFVDILGDFWRFFSVGEVKEGDLGKNGVVFDKDNFIKSAKTKQVQYFLEWFTETAMFNHFIQNMAVSYHHLPSPPSEGLVDTPLPDFYELFHERVRSRTTKSENKLNDSKVNYKSAVNKKVKLLKTKLRDLVA